MKIIKMAAVAAQRTVLILDTQSMVEDESLNLEQSPWLDFVSMRVSHFHSSFSFV